MMFLGTSPCEPAVAAALDHREIGLMCQPRSNNPRPGWIWAADNGCFNSTWQEPEWLKWLFRPYPRAGCLFAVVPDVVGDAPATLERFGDYLECVRDARYPIAYAAQNGSEVLAPPWDDLDCLFIGGTTDWKMSPMARELAVEAKSRGKWVHVGRVNSSRRFRAWLPLADSCDGTTLAFGPKTNIGKVLSWGDHARQQRQFALGAT